MFLRKLLIFISFFFYRFFLSYICTFIGTYLVIAIYLLDLSNTMLIGFLSHIDASKGTNNIYLVDPFSSLYFFHISVHSKFIQ